MKTKIIFAYASHLLLGALLTISTVSAHAGSTLTSVLESGKLVVGTSGNMPPMTLQTEDGKTVGFDLDIARLTAQTMGVELVVKVIPFDKLLPAVQSGEVDLAISNITMTPDRNLQVAFVGPYLVSGKCIITKEPQLAQSTSIADFNTVDTKLAVLKGSTSELFVQELLPEASVTGVDDLFSGVDLVKKDEVVGLMTEYPMCMEAVSRNPEAGFMSVFSSLTYEPIGVALPGDDVLFINWMQNFLSRLENTNLFDALRRKWLGEMTLQRVDPPADEQDSEAALDPGSAPKPATEAEPATKQ